MKRRLVLFAPIAALITACGGSSKDTTAGSAPANAPTVAPAQFATVHWIHATH